MPAADTSLGRFIEGAPFASAMFDRNMTYLYVSPRWREDYGLGQRELRGISHYEIFRKFQSDGKRLTSLD